MIEQRASTAVRPLVVILCALPILSGAIEEELGWLCDLQVYPPERGAATDRFLDLVGPDGIVVVNGQYDIAAAERHARAAGIPLLHVDVSAERMRCLVAGEWEDVPVRGDSARVIGDVLASELAHRGRQ